MSFFVPNGGRRNQAFKESFWSDLAGWRTSSSGKTVNMQTAIQVSTIFACCRVLGNGVAQVPLKLMIEGEDGRTRVPAKKKKLYNIMALRPNAWQSSYEFRQMISWHVELCGNAFVFISRNYLGEIIELIPFEPGLVTVKRDANWALTYDVQSTGGSVKTFPASEIWHIRGPSMNGFTGLDVVAVARDAIGLSMALEESAAQLHKNGARASGVYSVDATLDAKQYKDLSAWVNSEMGGLNNTGKIAVIDRAAKFLNTSMTGIDAQALESRNQQIQEICAFMGVLPILAGHSSKASTFASAEEMFRAHRENGLSPRWTAYEQSMSINLLTQRERDEGYYFNFVEEGLSRGSITDTKDAILGYVNGGIMFPNEGRALLDLNPDTDPASDRLRIPANIVGDTTKLQAAKE